MRGEVDRGEVDREEVDRFLKRLLELCPEAQAIFDNLRKIYEQWPVMYDTEGPQTEFNLRYSNHPQTNLSEANAVDYFLRAGFEVKYVTDQTNQNAGRDVYYKRKDEEKWTDVSVKLCTVFTKGNGLSIHYKIQDALKCDQSCKVFFVDNIHTNGMLAEMSDVQSAHMPVSPYNSEKRLLWFDKLPTLKIQLFKETK